MNERADDVEVIRSALAWLEAGQRVALATVVRTWGTSPRPPGSMLAMNDDGQFVGSVSGGCVEDALVDSFRDNEIAGPGPTVIDFGVNREEAERMGLPCGGRLEVLVENQITRESIDDLLARLHDAELVSRRVSLITGEVVLEPGVDGAEFQVYETEIVKSFGPDWQLLIIGDGQLARHLASMAQQLGYRIAICDPRGNFTATTPLPGVRYLRAMPDDVIRGLSDQTRTAIVALTHDPRLDDLAVSAALESRAFYIGALGSKKTALARHKRLESLGHISQQLNRIHGPAGISIGSKRPAEIAVSILAQITAIRNGFNSAAE